MCCFKTKSESVFLEFRIGGRGILGHGEWEQDLQGGSYASRMVVSVNWLKRENGRSS